MNLDSLEPAVVEEVLMRHGACSVTLSDVADTPVLEPGPGETPLWAETRITALFEGGTDFTELETALKKELGALPPFRIESLPDRAWEREWLRDFGPMRFGERLWIAPGESVVEQEDAVIVRLDPGLAFGTGTHPTTAMCLEWLDSRQLHGKTLLDYGCGSGVLAIAALKLGCRAATAMDIDPQALIATKENATQNSVAEYLNVVGAAVDIEGQFDVVVANILAGPLVEFAESITSTVCSHGMLALSGVLCEQAQDVMKAYEPWIRFEKPVYREQDGQTWSRLTGTRR